MSQVERVKQDFSTIGAIEEKLSPMDAVRAYCAQCLGMNQWNQDKIEDCQGDQAACGPCPLYPYRLGKRPTMKTFRKFCLDCVKGDMTWIAECPSTTCPCYPYRMGSNPAKKGQGASAEHMKKMRESRNNRLESTNPLQGDPTPTGEVISSQNPSFIARKSNQMEVTP